MIVHLRCLTGIVPHLGHSPAASCGPRSTRGLRSGHGMLGLPPVVVVVVRSHPHLAQLPRHRQHHQLIPITHPRVARFQVQPSPWQAMFASTVEALGGGGGLSLSNMFQSNFCNRQCQRRRRWVMGGIYRSPGIRARRMMPKKRGGNRALPPTPVPW